MRHQARLSAYRSKTYYCLLSGVVLLLFLSSTASAIPSENDDSYIAGYACAILDREFKGAATLLHVREGVITIRVENIESAMDREGLTTLLSSIRGVVRVDVREPEGYNNIAAKGDHNVTKTDTAEAEAESPANDASLLPRGKLFEPLIADPRWPHFSASYQCYIDDDELKNVGATSFGESFAFLRREAPFGGKWQLGIQAAVFAVFDLGAESLDLINADYWVGFPVSYRTGKFSSLLRIFHQSSHLGDEYLLRNRIDRVNLSYEGIDVKLSYDFAQPFRIYGGGGFLFHRDPSDLAPWSMQCGLEMKSPYTFWNGKMRPIGGINLQSWEETNWDPDLCLRMGIQFEGSEETSRRIQLMLEYFNGHSPHGQFYRRTIEYVGFGTHLYF